MNHDLLAFQPELALEYLLVHTSMYMARLDRVEAEIETDLALACLYVKHFGSGADECLWGIHRMCRQRETWAFSANPDLLRKVKKRLEEISAGTRNYHLYMSPSYLIRYLRTPPSSFAAMNPLPYPSDTAILRKITDANLQLDDLERIHANRQACHHPDRT
jgi:hypothetical protein